LNLEARPQLSGTHNTHCYLKQLQLVQHIPLTIAKKWRGKH